MKRKSYGKTAIPKRQSKHKDLFDAYGMRGKRKWTA
jgi:hypothetical protein